VIVDAHQHFWRYDPRDYAWIDDSMAALKRDFLPSDLEPLIRATGVDRTIAVQACQTTAETDWLLQLADRHAFIAGVIGWVDLQADDVEARVERVAKNRKLVGVRHVVQSEPDDGFMLRPAFGRGVATLARHGLVYDILIYPRHLPVASDFVEHFDTQTFVLDHLAKPEIRSRSIDTWARDLRRLAQHPNVWCKVSGLVTEADWQRWTAKDLEPYLDVAFDAFGPGRLIAGSDWPVCTLAGDYSRTMAVLRDYLERRTAAERKAVLGGNAQRVWKRGKF
jgi:L-fuconolactonase